MIKYIRANLKTYVKVLIGFLLLISLSINFAHLYVGNRVRPGIIRGTFLSGCELSDGLYLTLYPHGRYVKYSQFHIIEYGNFIHREGDDYILLFYNEDGQLSAQAIHFRFNDVIYLISGDGEIMVFERISNIPTYINVEPMR